MKYHRYFHHLISSQAMCINFFYPLIKEKLLDEIITILGIKGEVNYNNCDVCFEKESELEKGTQSKINFDFYIKLKSGVRIFFEIKYTERDFGKAKNDTAHRKKFYNIYLPILKENKSIRSRWKTEERFLNNYQLMRNLIHINKYSYVVFIYPSENKGISNASIKARKEIIENGWKNHYILFTWEDLVEQLITRLNSNELIDYYKKEFSNKYFR
jgi:hypothetical protein